ncbi:uncharacterized protein B0H18DRAFT_881198, partial [Fomitopsis serialis]|uniref:uncharacterized protein n=1 Tax=Fomitopsis serialis TaxID=139415 RepID=UPI002008E582
SLAAALSCSLYDHAINAAREIELVWRQQWSRLQIIVMLNTYLMEASLIIIAYGILRSQDVTHRDRCEAFVIFIGTFSTLSSGCQEFALLLHVYALWDSRKQAKYALIAGFIVCYGASVAFTLVTMIQLSGKMQYNSDLQSCVVPEKPTFLSGAWAGMVAYDVYVFVLTVLNALNRPRKKNVEIVSRLKRDGVVTFLVRELRLAMSIGR